MCEGSTKVEKSSNLNSEKIVSQLRLKKMLLSATQDKANDYDKFGKKIEIENLIFLPITVNACRRINKANRKVKFKP